MTENRIGEKDGPGAGRPAGKPNITTRTHIVAQDKACVEKGRVILKGKKSATDGECMLAWYKSLENKELVAIIGRRMPKKTELDLGDKMSWAALVGAVRTPELPIKGVTTVPIDACLPPVVIDKPPQPMVALPAVDHKEDLCQLQGESEGAAKP